MRTAFITVATTLEDLIIESSNSTERINNLLKALESLYKDLMETMEESEDKEEVIKYYETVMSIL